MAAINNMSPIQFPTMLRQKIGHFPAGPTSRVFTGPPGATKFPSKGSGPSASNVPVVPAPGTLFPPSTQVSSPKGKQVVDARSVKAKVADALISGAKAEVARRRKASAKVTRKPGEKSKGLAGNNARVLRESTGAK